MGTKLLASAFLLVIIGSLQSALLLSAWKRFCLPQTVAALATTLLLGFSRLLATGLTNDSATYHLAATAQSYTWSGLPVSSELSTAFRLATADGKQSLTWILGSMYHFASPSEVWGIILSGILMSSVPLLLATSTRLLGDPQAAPIAAWAAVFAPPLVIWAPGIGRESLAFFLLSVLVLAISLIWSGRYPLGAFVFICVVTAIYVTRSHLNIVSAVLLVSVLLGITFRNTSLSKLSRAPIRDLTLLMSATLLLLLIRFFGEVLEFIPYNWQRLDVIVRANSNPQYQLAVTGVAGDSNRTFPIWLANLTRASWGPFPWEWDSLTWTLVGLDGMFFLILFLLVAVGLFQQPRFGIQYFSLIIAGLALMGASALTFANYGIESRVRAHLIPLWIPVVATYVYTIKARIVTSTRLRSVSLGRGNKAKRQLFHSRLPVPRMSSVIQKASSESPVKSLEGGRSVAPSPPRWSSKTLSPRLRGDRLSSMLARRS